MMKEGKTASGKNKRPYGSASDKKGHSGHGGKDKKGSRKKGSHNGGDRPLGVIRRPEEELPGFDGRKEHDFTPRYQTMEELEDREELILDLLKDPNYEPLRKKEIALILNVPKEDRNALAEVLDHLYVQHKVEINRRGRYTVQSRTVLTGVFCGNARGFGFVTVEGREEDVFISNDHVGSAMHGDTVEIMILKEDVSTGRAEGAVIRVIEHANDRVVGLYEKHKTNGFVIPDNTKLGKDIFIPAGRDLGAVKGHKVVVRITDFGNGHKNPEGEIIEILGHLDDPGVDILSIVEAYNLPQKFPEEVEEELRRIPEHVSKEEAEETGRLDLRDLPTVTIDGDGTKDFDDAVTLEKTGTGWRLGVHIADVTHYVAEHSPLDEEALRRGTSVYLVDRVIPMLPHQLSNGICSLNEGEDRLTLSCIMEIGPRGAIHSHRITESVIRVDRRMTYRKVNRVIMDHDLETMKEYQGYTDLLEEMFKVSKRLRSRRHARGSVDFEFPESEIRLDENGKPVEILAAVRGEAERVIEDFMLAANETVAKDFHDRKLPFLYRIHEDPDPEKVKKLASFGANFGVVLHTKDGKITPKLLQEFLEKSAGKAEAPLLEIISLRSMQQAKYAPQNLGHFGLAAPYYCHFTSPIRRYPDLQIHRIIRETLRGEMSPKRIAHYDTILPNVAVQTSSTERRADEAERETDKLKKVQYMERYIGEELDGTISSVTGWGFYVQLPNTCEGLVHIAELTDDYYIFDEQHYELVGRMTGKKFRIGQPIRVFVTGCDRFMRTVDFIPANKSWE